MYRSRSRRIRKQGQPEVNLTPLIDTALTLLIIFMVATPIAHHAIRVRLPDAGTVSAMKSEEFVLYIDQDQKLFFNGDPVSKEAVVETIEQALKGKQERQVVFVKGDKAVPYGQVMEMVKYVQQTGNVKQVALSTQRL